MHFTSSWCYVTYASFHWHLDFPMLGELGKNRQAGGSGKIIQRGCLSLSGNLRTLFLGRHEFRESLKFLGELELSRTAVEMVIFPYKQRSILSHIPLSFNGFNSNEPFQISNENARQRQNFG